MIKIINFSAKIMYQYWFINYNNIPNLGKTSIVWEIEYVFVCVYSCVPYVYPYSKEH